MLAVNNPLDNPLSNLICFEYQIQYLKHFVITNKAASKAAGFLFITKYISVTAKCHVIKVDPQKSASVCMEKMQIDVQRC
jgi:hypothetical protein